MLRGMALCCGLLVEGFHEKYHLEEILLFCLNLETLMVAPLRFELSRSRL